MMDVQLSRTELILMFLYSYVFSGNVHGILQIALGRTITPIGCGAHILHNALSTAVSKVIPIDIENIVVKIHYHFRIYTQRVEKFKEFCNFVECNIHTILSHCQTRWLSLYPCIERLLKQWDAFKSYFLTEKGVPLILYNFFNSDVSQFWVLFIHPQLQLFHNTLEAIQAPDLTAVEISHRYQRLLNQFKDRQEKSFVPFTALNNLRTEALSLTENGVKAVAKNFYYEVVEYMEAWSRRLINYDDFKIFMLNECVEETEFATACHEILKITISDNNLFDVCSAMNEVVQREMRDPNWSKENMKKKWETVLKDFLRADVDITILKRIVEVLFVLPGTNSDCEGIFSEINSYWTDEKSQLQVSTLEGIMKVKNNCRVSCNEFFEIIKNKSDFLSKVLSSEKYEQ